MSLFLRISTISARGTARCRRRGYFPPGYVGFSLSLGRNEFPGLANPDVDGFATLSCSCTEHIPQCSPGAVFSSKALSALGEVLLLHILLLILCKIST